MRPRIVLGWREPVSLPDWGVDRLHAKIDTGARSSAVHVENLVELPDGRIQFEVVLSRRANHRRVTVVSPVSRRSHVRSSNGQTEPRYFVRTRMVLGPIDREIEVSLVKRDSLTCRMLVGRSALPEEAVVAPHEQDLHGEGAA